MKTRFSLMLGGLTVAGGLVSIGCGGDASAPPASSAPSALTGSTSVQASRVSGTVVSSGAGQMAAAQSSTPVPGVRVSLAGNGQSVMTDNRGQFTLNNTPVGSNQLQFDNGSRGSVNVNTQSGMELNVAVALSGPNATVTCQANRPLGTTNVANACDILDGGGNNGNNGSNGANGGNGGNGGNNGSGGNGGSNGGSNGGGS